MGYGQDLLYVTIATCMIQCETHGTVALDALHTQLLQPPTKVGVIGSGCSLATEPTAQISHYYNVTHVSKFKAPVITLGACTYLLANL